MAALLCPPFPLLSSGLPLFSPLPSSRKEAVSAGAGEGNARKRKSGGGPVAGVVAFGTVKGDDEASARGGDAAAASDVGLRRGRAHPVGARGSGVRRHLGSLLSLSLSLVRTPPATEEGRDPGKEVREMEVFSSFLPGCSCTMGIPKVLLLSLVFSVALVGIRAEAGVADDGAELYPPEDPSALRSELEQLRSKVSAFESTVAERNRQLKAKEETILEFENVVKEKSESIASLQAEIESLQKKGAVDAAELLGKAHARAAELEKQIENLKGDIQTQNRKRDAFEARAIEAENTVGQLNLKLERLQKTSDEQKVRIQKTERALKVAEEELMKVQLEASSKKKELTEIHGAWLPPWLATHLDQCQATASAQWNKHGKPAYDACVIKMSEILAQAHEKIKPHLETARKTWIPAMEERWTTVRTSADPYMKLVATKAVVIYETSVNSVKPHLIRVQEAADPYLQEARKFSKPYIDQVATITKPHVEKARVALKPYTKKVVRVYRRSLKSATTYHRQVQSTVEDRLKKHELTKTLATKEFVWFAASALLALPIFFAIQLLASIFCKKPRKNTQSAHANHGPRRHKRRHADK